MYVQHVNLETFKKILPIELIERLAIKHNVDKCNQIKLPGTLMFACLLETMLLGDESSLRDLEYTYQDRTGETIHHSTFGKRFAKISVDFFREIFEHLYTVISDQTPQSEKNSLRVHFVDATIVALSARLLKVGLLVNQKTKKGPLRFIKAVYSLSEHGLPSILRICSNTDEHSDCVAIGDPILARMQPNDMFVFDAGMTDRERMLTINNGRAYFITRHVSQKLNIHNIVYEADLNQINHAEPRKGEPTYQLLRVEDCRFGTKSDGDKYENFPLVVIYGRRWNTRDKTWSSLVNMTNLPLSDDNTKLGDYTFEDVAELYRRRWEIETFFRFIKQELGYSHILSRNKNGIEVMIYMTLINSMLLAWFKKTALIARSWKSAKRRFIANSVKWLAELFEDAIWNLLATRKNRPLRM
jgi:hypothetical protein